MPRAVKRGAQLTWDYVSKAAADSNLKDMKKRGVKNVKVEKIKVSGKTIYRLSAKL